jgi:hypothetical protein
MKIHEYKELEDGGADLEVELTAEEARTLIEVGLAKVLKDFAEQHENQFEDRVEDVWKGDKDHWINRMDEDE